MYFYIVPVQCLLVLIIIGSNSSDVLACEVIGLGNYIIQS